MLSLNNLTYILPNGRGFKNLSFTLGDCCLVVIKTNNPILATSLLEIIVGLKKSHNGNILYANENVKESRYYAEFCEMTNYIPRNSYLKPYLTVYDNISFWSSLRGDRQQIEAALSFLGLSGFKNKYLKTLSLDSQKRAAIAMLLARKSEIWLLDNPHNDLDNENKIKLNAIINSRIGQGGMVIAATDETIGLSDFFTIDLDDFRA